MWRQGGVWTFQSQRRRVRCLPGVLWRKTTSLQSKFLLKCTFSWSTFQYIRYIVYITVYCFLLHTIKLSNWILSTYYILKPETNWFMYEKDKTIWISGSYIICCNLFNCCDFSIYSSTKRTWSQNATKTVWDQICVILPKWSMNGFLLLLSNPFRKKLEICGYLVIWNS